MATPFANIPVLVLLFALYACATITPLVVLVRNAVRESKGGSADLLSSPLRTAGWLLTGLVVCDLRLGLAPSVRQWWARRERLHPRIFRLHPSRFGALGSAENASSSRI